MAQIHAHSGGRSSLYTLTLRRMSVDSGVVGEARVRPAAGARAVGVVAVPRELDPLGAKEFLVADAEGPRALHFPVPDREVPYLRPEFDITVTPGAVTVTAHTLVRDSLLQADRLQPQARADRGLVTLPPGEPVTIAVRGWETPDPDAAWSALYSLEPTP